MTPLHTRPALPDYQTYASYEVINYRYFFDIDDGHIVSNSDAWHFSGLCDSSISKHSVKLWLSRYYVENIDTTLLRYWKSIYYLENKSQMPLIVYDSIDDENVFMCRRGKDDEFKINDSPALMIVIRREMNFWVFVHQREIRTTWFLYFKEYPHQSNIELIKQWIDIPLAGHRYKRSNTKQSHLEDGTNQSYDMSMPAIIEAFNIFGRMNKSLHRRERLETWDKRVAVLPVRKAGLWCVHAAIMKCMMDRDKYDNVKKVKYVDEDYEGLTDWLLFKLNLAEPSRENDENKEKKIEFIDFKHDPVAKVLKKRMTEWDLKHFLWSTYITDKKKYRKIFKEIEKSTLQNAGLNYNLLNLDPLSSFSRSISSKQATSISSMKDSLTYFMETLTLSKQNRSFHKHHSQSNDDPQKHIQAHIAALSHLVAHYQSHTHTHRRKQTHIHEGEHTHTPITSMVDFDYSICHMMIDKLNSMIEDACKSMMYMAKRKSVCLTCTAMRDMQKAVDFVPDKLARIISGERNIFREFDLILLPVIEPLPLKMTASILAQSNLKELANTPVSHCFLFIIYTTTRQLHLYAPALSRSQALDQASIYQSSVSSIINFGMRSMACHKPSSTFSVSIIDRGMPSHIHDSHARVMHMIYDIVVCDNVSV